MDVQIIETGQLTINPFDLDLKIKWPIKRPILSDKDRNNKPFKFYFN